jgi:hypothetical protein
VSIPRTQAAILLQRSRFLLEGLLRPLLMVIPALFLYPFWKKLTLLPAQPAALALWAAATASIAWWAVLTMRDRQELGAFVRRLLYLRADSPR